MPLLCVFESLFFLRNGVLSELADQTGERRALEEIANASTS